MRALRRPSHGARADRLRGLRGRPAHRRHQALAGPGGVALNLAFVLLSGPRHESAHTVGALAAAALESGHEVSVFVAGDGTAHLDELAPLRDRGARVVACSADAAVRGWDRPGAAGRGSFVDLGGMVADCERLLVFR